MLFVDRCRGSLLISLLFCPTSSSLTVTDGAIVIVAISEVTRAGSGEGQGYGGAEMVGPPSSRLVGRDEWLSVVAARAVLAIAECLAALAPLRRSTTLSVGVPTPCAQVHKGSQGVRFAGRTMPKACQPWPLSRRPSLLAHS